MLASTRDTLEFVKRLIPVPLKPVYTVASIQYSRQRSSLAIFTCFYTALL